LVKPDEHPGKVDTSVWYFKDNQENSITSTAYDHNTILTSKQLTITNETISDKQVKVAYIKDPIIKAKLDTLNMANGVYFPVEGPGSVYVT